MSAPQVPVHLALCGPHSSTNLESPAGGGLAQRGASLGVSVCTTGLSTKHRGNTRLCQEGWRKVTMQTSQGGALWRRLPRSSCVASTSWRRVGRFFLVRARPFGSTSVGWKGAVSPPGASALLLEVGAFPGSQHCPAQLLSCHLLVGLGCPPKWSTVHLAKHTHHWFFSYRKKLTCKAPQICRLLVQGQQ